MLTTVIDCVDLDAEVSFLCDEVGLRVHLVSPADDPRVVVVEDPRGGRIEVRRSAQNRPGRLVVHGAIGRTLQTPGGTIIELAPADVEGSSTVGADMVVPANQASLTVVDSTDGSFGVGRAGMEYRDLLPDRWGGRFVASHIRIDEGGDVADWVHFHRIRFQMVYVASGWVDVVYEGQGEPFRMEAGDCVLHPPEIRHRVLRSSAGLEVIEIGCPAEHDTIADHDLVLPTSADDPNRDFCGQRFVRHVAAHADIAAWVDPSMWVRDAGIAAATDGLAGALVVGPDGSASASPLLGHDGEFAMLVGLAGVATIEVFGRSVELWPRTSIAVPAGVTWRWSAVASDHEALVVTLPGAAIHLA